MYFVRYILKPADNKNIYYAGHKPFETLEGARACALRFRRFMPMRSNVCVIGAIIEKDKCHIIEIIKG